jgi:type VI secretion system secreted protein Hcp
MKTWISAGAAVVVMTLAGTVSADSVALSLKVQGSDVGGEGRGGAIDCINFEQAVETAREAGSGAVTGRRNYAPLKCTKKIDKSSPLLVKALATNQAVEGVFRFYRPGGKGGTEEQYYTIAIKQARVSSMKIVNTPSATLEEVSFVFTSITFTYTSTGAMHEDNVAAVR